MKKAIDYYRVVSLVGNVLTVAFTLETPSESNVSQSTGKSHVIGRAFGKLPYRIKGTQLRINANIMLPIEGAKEENGIVDIEITSTTPPVIPPPSAPDQDNE
jgi:hypothetical protein